MLVLTRKVQQQIQIGGGITISILKVRGNSVRVGIEAPSDVKILRSELPVFDTDDEDQSTRPDDSKTGVADRSGTLPPLGALVDARRQMALAEL